MIPAEKNSLFFLLNTRYPTEKAYGVTTGRTCQAINESGSKAFILAPTGDNRDSYGNHIFDVSQYLINTYPPREKAFRIWHTVRNVQDSLKIRKRIREMNIDEQHPIFICREWLQVIILSVTLPAHLFVFEVHRYSSWLRRLITSPLVFLKGLRIITITDQSLKDWESAVMKSRLLNLPMGVEESFFQPPRLSASTEWLRIVFVGKAKSSGEDNGLDALLSGLRIIASNDFRIHVSLVGIESNEVAQLKKYENTYLRLEFISHIKHQEIPLVLRQSTIGIVPYPENRYHNYRFPIKILEYAASSLVILASDTPSHRAILDESLAFFYSTKDVRSLKSALSKIRLGGKEVGEKVICAQNWAKQFTYQKRALKLLEFLGRKTTQ